VKSLIQRCQLMDNLYAYGNVDSGRIHGWELEMDLTPILGWSKFGNAFTFNGKSARSFILGLRYEF